MEYVKHKYSKRIYQIMTDHGPDHPYLWNPWEFSIREPSKLLMSKFFSQCEKPPTMPTEYHVSIPRELEWERKQLMGDQPIVVHSPVSKPRIRTTRKPQDGSEEYTLADLCGELGMDPAKARKLLRSKGKTPPPGGWKWPDKKSAKAIRRFLKKF